LTLVLRRNATWDNRFKLVKILANLRFTNI